MNLSYESALNLSRQICSQTQTTESKIKTDFSVDLLHKDTDNKATENGILWILLCTLQAACPLSSESSKWQSPPSL